MKIERTKNASRNIVFGTVLKLYQILLPFLMRTIMIYLLGVEYVGLNSLFTSVLQVLNLTELGVGSAMVYSMYKPIAEDDTKTICAYMNLYRKYYRIIGVVILVMGLALTPILDKLIRGTVPADINVYVLYYMYLGATVLTYWLFAYKNSILTACQRLDVNNKVTIVTDTIKYAAQILVLCVFKNYYYYVLAIMLTQIINNIVTAYLADRMYPQFIPAGKLEKSEVDSVNRRIRDLFTSKIGTVVVNSSGTIVISAFLGLTVLAIYQNYFYLFTAVTGIVAVVFGACTAGIGNSIILESKEKNVNDFKKFTFLITWIAGLCTCCFLNLYQPFIELWVGKELLMDFSIVVCLCIYFYIYELNALLNLFKDAAGMWHKDRFRPLVTAIVNLVISICLVQIWGLYGIVLATVLSALIVGMPWLIHNLFTTVFESKYLKAYIFSIGRYAGVTAVACVITYTINSFICFSLIGTILVRGVVCFVISNVIFWMFYHKTKEYEEMLQLLNKMTKGRLKIKR